MYGYTLNGIAFSVFGITEGQLANSNLAIEGAFDMPSRIGKVFHDWGDENGIEPYLRSDEIFFGGRDIKFYGFMKFNNRNECINNLNAFYEVFDNANALLPLVSVLGSWNVGLSSAVDIQYDYSNNFAEVEFSFREPVVEFPSISLPVANPASLDTIDGISWDDLGIIILDVTQDLNRPSPKDYQDVFYSSEIFTPTKRTFRQVEVKGLINQTTWVGFKNVLNRLYKLLAMPNARVLRSADGTVREVFAKDGVQVRNVHYNEGQIIAEITMKLTEIHELKIWNKLTDSTGLILTDKHGQALSEIIKKF